MSATEVVIEPAEMTATLPRTLREFREKRLNQSRKADQVRAKLSDMVMSDIATHHLQDLQNAMADCGLKLD